ncbi:trans-acting enoyl reductase family protein [Janibacter sp. GXQ6167]|uniref:saccharopine dehydrogenase family protein n=1 Tax=Janibacter sp. GXQ6167 TaxID=3240791 RepID=UPI003523124D
MAEEREFDIILVGATGFVGRLTAEHLRDHAPTGTRIALAGRSPDRLARLGADLGGVAETWPQIVVDTTDRTSCDELAARTTTVITTVGPYARYGHELIRACAEAGTHYCDLTGEVLFVRDVADGLHELARQTGARLVTSCGFDSIPSDLAVWEAARTAREAGAGELGETTLYVRSLRGGVSGGTIDSMRQQAIAAAHDQAARKIVIDPYGLSPDRAAEPRSSDTATAKAGGVVGTAKRLVDHLPVSRDDQGHWTGPFVMASYNTRIVRRTNALLAWRYGRGFRYREVMDFGTKAASPLMATGMAAALGGLVAGMTFAPTRTLLGKVLPEPGEGPSAESQAKGRFRMEVVAETTMGRTVRSTVAAKADPGYSGTAIMLGQSGLCLALDDLTSEGGVLTPAVAMAEPLIERLRAQDFTITSSLD